MGLFSFSYNKPGPGVSPDTPRKRGVARLLEVLGRDTSIVCTHPACQTATLRAIIRSEQEVDAK